MRNGARRIILTFGSIYGSRRIDTFCQALQLLIESGAIRREVQVLFLGDVEPEQMTAAQRPRAYFQTRCYISVATAVAEAQRLLWAANVTWWFKASTTYRCPRSSRVHSDRETYSGDNGRRSCVRRHERNWRRLLRQVGRSQPDRRCTDECASARTRTSEEFQLGMQRFHWRLSGPSSQPLFMTFPKHQAQAIRRKSIKGCAIQMKRLVKAIPVLENGPPGLTGK